MSFVKIWIHAVWGTRDRSPILKPPVLFQLCAHIRSNAKEKGIHIDIIDGHDDHIHVLMLLHVDNSISKQMQLIKGESAFWANKNNMIKGGLSWADKYFAASVSDDKVEIVRAYVRNQNQHHRKVPFKEEYDFFLKSLGYKENFG